jgi:hypothetical protein
MKKYIDLLKKCKTYNWASQVYIACLLDNNLKNSEKNDFQIIYIEYTKNNNLK